MKRPQLICAIALVAVVASAGRAGAEPAKNLEESGPIWSLTLGGGAVVPIGVMADDYQNALVAGIRLGIRAQVGIGVELALDYSPLPRRDVDSTMFDTTYGTAVLMPAWTLGKGLLRLQIAGGGGAGFEVLKTTTPDGTTEEKVWMPVVAGQMAVHIHVTKGGGVAIMAGGTRTFRDREYQYGWAMAGLTLEF